MSVRRGARRSSALVVVLGLASVTATAMAEGALPSPSPSPATGPGWIGADTEVYRDVFSTPTGWSIIDDDAGRTAYQDGGLLMSAASDGSTVWDDHRLPDAHAVLRVEALVSGLEGAGAAGVACGSALGVPRYLFAAVTDAADWITGRIIDGRVQVLARGPLPGDVDASHVRVGIECASAPDEGGDHVLVTLDGVSVAIPRFDIPVGPYDAATLVTSADVAPVSVLFDDLLVHAGAAYAPRAQERDPDAPSV